MLIFFSFVFSFFYFKRIFFSTTLQCFGFRIRSFIQGSIFQLLCLIQLQTLFSATKLQSNRYGRLFTQVDEKPGSYWRKWRCWKSEIWHLLSVPDTKECFTSFVSGTPSKIAKYLSHNKLTSGCFYPCAERMTNEVLEIVFP